jgi:Mrp family chromosome partitioning ATPase
MKTDFAVVLLDFDPASASPEAASLEAQTNAVLVVIEWGVTPRGTVMDAIVANGIDEDRIMGSVLNNVDARWASRFQA